MRTLAVLPVKTFSRAKQRLGEALAASQRPQLADAMVQDVLETLTAVREIAAVVVVTAEPRAAALARAAGAIVVHDDAEAGQSAAALLGIAEALRRGADRALLVPGDCPALEPDELRTLLSGTARVTIVPDRHGTGTNALLLAPPDVLTPSFGPGSFERHRTLAGDAAVAELPSLCLDVDTPADLATLQARAGGARRTRAVLDGLLTAT